MPISQSSRLSLPKMITKTAQIFLVIIYLTCIKLSHAECSRGCKLAIASYYLLEKSNLSYISNIFNFRTTAPILEYNPNITSQDSIQTGSRLRIPFPCDCLNGSYLAHTFTYVTQLGDTYQTVAQFSFANLTTVDWLQRINVKTPSSLPNNSTISITVNCSCGDARISKDYGLFETYPLRPGENLSNVSTESGVAADLIKMYNPGFNFSAGNGLLFVPTKDSRGQYFPSLKSRKGRSGGVIVGICMGVLGGIILTIYGYYKIFRRKKVVNGKVQVQSSSDQDQCVQQDTRTLKKSLESTSSLAGNSPRPSGIKVDRSVEFSYKELAEATDDFNLTNKIGEGGFGYVFYAELRGEKAAIKRMDVQASQEFLAELKVLTHVHHLNLVRLIGYCVEGSLFLVYEYIENGNLGQHLRCKGITEALSWPARVQIALDSARGLEYIHEHTVPVYIHRDIKPANILLDKNFRAKVADFGLTKLADINSTGSLHTRLVGTFGYMPPEYAQYGEVSAKVDVYAFGVVLYELISAKEAIVKTNQFIAESTGLVSLFEYALRQPEPKSDLLRNLVDPNLGDKYPVDSVRKMAQLAKACTQENPQLRPSMRSIVVALVTLSSSNEDWDVGSFYENEALVNLTTGR